MTQSNYSPKHLAQEFLSDLPLPIRTDGSPERLIAATLKNIRKAYKPLIVVSTICPSYSTDSQGIPTYTGMENGISPNTQKHLTHIVPAVQRLTEQGVDAKHIFLMADTEVDLLPFLQKLQISPDVFLERCQESLGKVRAEIENSYGTEPYNKDLPSAASFLEYFGVEDWYHVYGIYYSRLLTEAETPGRVQSGLERDYTDRQKLIRSLLGDVSKEEGINHIARQKAQYMAFASLIRQRFEGQLVIVNHRTPNLAWMNDEITREHPVAEQQEHGNYLPKLPLVELDISTLPHTS